MFLQWWHERNKREQTMLIGGGIISIILLIYALIWAPLLSAITTQQRHFQENTQLLQWMNAAHQRFITLQQLGRGPKNESNQPILVIIEQSLLQSKLSPYVLNTSALNSRSIQLTFKNIPFDKFTTWVDNLWKKYNITTQRSTIKKDRSAGTTDIIINLKKS